MSGRRRRWVTYEATIAFVCQADEDDEVEREALSAVTRAAVAALKGRMPSVLCTGPRRRVALSDDAFNSADPDDGTRTLGAESNEGAQP